MSNYRFTISKKSDHTGPNGKSDLHVHVYYKDSRSEKLIGRYRIPTLEPIFTGARELNNKEIDLLKAWLGKKDQLKKLEDALKSTLFDIHKAIVNLPEFSELKTENDGETYLTIKIPVTRRLK